MAVVIDASLIVVLVSRDARAAMTERQMQVWLDTGEELHAPALITYEVANALTRLVAAGRLPANNLEEVWALVERLPLQLHLLTSVPPVVETAVRLGRQSAYDAAYIVLAQRLNAELWTLDGPLARNAAGMGFPVRLVE